MTTKSSAARSSCRKDSRARRLRRFLSMALFAARREIVKPRRASVPAFGVASTVKNRSAERSALAKTRANSDELARRRLRGKAALPERKPDRPGNLLRLRTKPLAPFRAPIVEYLAAPASGHAGSKSVRALATYVARLECSFHGRDDRSERSAKTSRCEAGGEPRTVRGSDSSVNTGRRAGNVEQIARAGRTQAWVPRRRLWITRVASY